MDLTTVAILLSFAWPMGLALAMGARALRPTVRRIGPWSALIGLGVGMWWPSGLMVQVDWLLLGTTFGLETPARLLMLLSGGLWTIAGLYARGYMAEWAERERDRFWFYFLLAMSGNLGLVAAQDLAGFYLFFALMSFASFGLVVHDGTVFARYAGKVYIVMAVGGEAALLSGILLAFHATLGTESEVPAALATYAHRDVAMALLLIGFGVKAGLVGVHMWLPLAHPAAPVPASAVLSGAMIKAGLLGWMRFMPAGEMALPGWGGLMMGLGLVAMFYGVIFGLVQRDAKATLAYSSVSQMGFMTVAVGLALFDPQFAHMALLAGAFYALHHGLAKGSLFLGVGVASVVKSARQGWWLMLGLGVGAFTLAGAPFTSGFVAKTTLKTTAEGLEGTWYNVLNVMLPMAAVGTTVLMGRFMFQMREKVRGLESGTTRPDSSRALWGAWGAWGWWGMLVIVVLTVAWVMPPLYDLDVARVQVLGRGALWAALWPVALGVLLVWLAWWWRRPMGEALALGPGDVLILFNWMARRVARLWHGHVLPVSLRGSTYLAGQRNKMLLKLGRSMFRGEMALVRWGSGGVVFVLVTLVLAALMWWGRL